MKKQDLPRYRQARCCFTCASGHQDSVYSTVIKCQELEALSDAKVAPTDVCDLYLKKEKNKLREYPRGRPMKPTPEQIEGIKECADVSDPTRGDCQRCVIATEDIPALISHIESQDERIRELGNGRSDFLVRSFDLIEKELNRAEELHPGWPPDIIHGAAIMCEEAGEAIKAAFDVRYNAGPISDYEKELIQTAAMCIRALQHT